MNFNPEDCNQKSTGRSTGLPASSTSRRFWRFFFLSTPVKLCATHVSDISVMQLVRFKKSTFSFAAKTRRLSRRLLFINSPRRRCTACLAARIDTGKGMYRNFENHNHLKHKFSYSRQQLY